MSHREAFCLMWYACKCSARERIWNSRDGVTPFCMNCASCGGDGTMSHITWEQDEYAPTHQLHPRQYFWRDGTPDEAEAFMRKRIESLRAEYPLTPEREAELIAKVRSGTPDSGFQKGWPMLDRHMENR